MHEAIRFHWNKISSILRILCLHSVTINADKFRLSAEITRKLQSNLQETACRSICMHQLQGGNIFVFQVKEAIPTGRVSQVMTAMAGRSGDSTPNCLQHNVLGSLR